jgi:hypothetical protein
MVGGVAHSYLKACALFLFLFLFFIAVYSHVIIYAFAYYDDYNVLFSATHHMFFQVLNGNVLSGRPVYAMLFVFYLFIHHIAGLVWLRLGAILGIVVLCSLLIRRLVKSPKTPFSAAISIAVSICLMPSFQIDAAWSVTAFYPWGALLAGLAYLETERASRLLDIHNLIAVAVLAISVMLYQPAAMMFWVFAAISWLLCDTRSVHPGRLAQALLIMAVALGLDFVSSKTFPEWIFNDHYVFQRTALVSNIFGKVWWFFHEVIPNCLNFTDIHQPAVIETIIVAIVIALGLWLSFEGALRIRLYKSAIALSLVPLAYAPNLIVAENWATYRTEVALTSLFTLYAGIAFITYFRRLGAALLLPFGLFVLVSVAAINAYQNVKYEFVLPQVAELRELGAYLSKHPDLSAAKSFYIVPAPQKSKFAAFVRYDEFGFSSLAAMDAGRGIIWAASGGKTILPTNVLLEARMGAEAEAPEDATILDFGRIGDNP